MKFISMNTRTFWGRWWWSGGRMPQFYCEIQEKWTFKHSSRKFKHIVFPWFHQRTSQYPTLLRLVIYSLLFTTTASEQSWCGDIVMLGECLQSPAASHLATQQVDRDQDPELEDSWRLNEGSRRFHNLVSWSSAFNFKTLLRLKTLC